MPRRSRGRLPLRAAPPLRVRGARRHAAARRVGPVGLLVVALLAVGCTSTASSDAPPTEPVRVAATGDPEGQVLSAVVVGLLEDADVTVETVGFSDARDARQALQLGAVDVAIGYSGEAWLASLGRADPPGDVEASFGPVRADDARRGIVWLSPRFDEGGGGAPANATFAFVVRGPPGAHADLRTVSQLAARLGEQPDATVCVDREFGSREDGLRAVLDAYRVRSDRPFVAADPQEAVQAVATGGCIAGLTTATDGGAWAAGLRPLEDDLGVFPAFVIAPQVREELLDERPEVRRALQPLTELTTTLLGSWNAAAIDGTPVEDLADTAAEELRARVAAREAASAAATDPA